MSVHDQDRDEARAAARFDRADYVSISGQIYDRDDVPDLADVADLGGA